MLFRSATAAAFHCSRSFPSGTSTIVFTPRDFHVENMNVACAKVPITNGRGLPATGEGAGVGVGLGVGDVDGVGVGVGDERGFFGLRASVSADAESGIELDDSFLQAVVEVMRARAANVASIVFVCTRVSMRVVGFPNCAW